jgi:hypothetical protein
MLDVVQTWRPGDQVRIRMDMSVRVVGGGPTYPDFVAVQRGPQVLALEKSLNADVPFLSRAALTKGQDAPALRTATASGWRGKQVYEIDGLAGVRESGASGQLRSTPRKLKLVPFADARNYRVWLTTPDRLRNDIPSAVVGARVYMSHVSTTGTAAERLAAAVHEYLTDDLPNTFLAVDSRETDVSTLPGSRTPKSDGTVWFVAASPEPIKLARARFRHGPLGEQGGWFDSSRLKPRLQIARQPMRVWSQDLRALKEFPTWEDVAVFESYPQTDGDRVPTFDPARVFEVVLPQPIEVHAIRLVGWPARNTVTCAELSLHTA